MVRGAHGKAMACLAPPLILTRPQADEIINRLEQALARLTVELPRSAP
jgi:adenosylmethionine-8-amino-7-oxononanoate aminotransferase